MLGRFGEEPNPLRFAAFLMRAIKQTQESMGSVKQSLLEQEILAEVKVVFPAARAASLPTAMGQGKGLGMEGNDSKLHASIPAWMTKDALKKIAIAWTSESLCHDLGNECVVLREC